MAADPRWLEIIKASGGQAFAIAGAAGGVLLLNHWKWIPPLEAWMVQAATGLLLLGTLLALVSFVSALDKFLNPRAWIAHAVRLRQQSRAAEQYVPFMNDQERAIIAYLLHHKMKTFTVDVDGGYASTLISRGIVVRALVGGQLFDQRDMPVAIPDHIWRVLEKHKEKFPHREDDDGAHPWRVHWMAR